MRVRERVDMMKGVKGVKDEVGVEECEKVTRK